MKKPAIEFLTPERAAELREELLTLLSAASNGHEIAMDSFTPELIVQQAVDGQAVIFLGFEDGEPTAVLAIQFFMDGARKGADIMAFAGQGMLSFKRYYWEAVINWLKANKVEYLDAYVDSRRVKVYEAKFGFKKSCALIRKTLVEVNDG
jgi:hypothetical protein